MSTGTDYADSNDPRKGLHNLVLQEGVGWVWVDIHIVHVQLHPPLSLQVGWGSMVDLDTSLLWSLIKFHVIKVQYALPDRILSSGCKKKTYII